MILTESVNDAKQQILEIQRIYRSAPPQFVLKSLSGAIDQLEKAFPSLGHFIMEFIQNADDEGAERFRVKLSGSDVTISNDGEPFSADDVDSLCMVGQSSKRLGEYIGYLGVGFKSVFLISERPEINSGAYHFRFDKRYWLQYEPTGLLPWQVLPIWSDDQSSLEEGFTTEFVIPTMGVLDRIREEVFSPNLSERILLFLQNLRSLDIVDSDRNLTRKMIRSENLTADSPYEEYELTNQSTDGSTRTKWVVFRRKVDVPESVAKDAMTIHWKRSEVKKREVACAFKLDEKGNLVVEQRGTAHAGVFSFLPLKDVPSGLRFLVQGDFLTGAGRSEIQRDALWNEWVCRELFNLIRDVCIPAFLENQTWKYQFTKLFWSVGGHELFEKFVAAPMRNLLLNSPLYISEGGAPASVQTSLVITPEYRDMFTADDVSALFPTRRILDRLTECPDELKYNFLRIENLHTAVSYLESVALKRAASRDLGWFDSVYSKFESFPEEYVKQATTGRRIALTDDFEVVAPGSVYGFDESVEVPNELKGQIKVWNKSVRSK